MQVRDLRAALHRLNPDIPDAALEQAIEKLTGVDFSRSLLQHNREFYRYIRDGVPVEWRDSFGETCHGRGHVIDFKNGIGPDGKPNNRFLAVRELKIQGVHSVAQALAPYYLPVGRGCPTSRAVH